MKIEVRTGRIEEVVALSQKIPEFEKPYTEKDYRKRLHDIHCILLAEVDSVPVGFKVGYDRFEDGQIFYSWMGGVLPEYRKEGVGKLLLQKMVIWCKLKGYRYLQFKTLNKHRSMLHFAIDQGFNVIDFKPNENPKESKVYFQKKL